MKYNRGELYWAEIKYEDSDTVEHRPILIWNDNKVFCVSFKVTSTDRGSVDAEYRIQDWRAAGLRNPSSVRLSHIMQIEKTKIKNKIGELSYLDMFNIIERLCRFNT